MERLDDLMRVGAERAGGKHALLFPDERTPVTYGELDQRASAFARTLQRRGVKPGARILLANANTAEFFVALFGASRAGCVAVPMDTNLAVPEIQAIAAHANATLVITDPASAAKVTGALPAITALGAEALAAGAETEAPTPVPVRKNDLVLILYTSGTTGVPKGVMHSHATLLSKVETIKDWFKFDDSFRSLCLLPTHFGHGLICNCLSTFFYGGTLVLCRPFDFALVSRLPSILEQFQINTFSSVPAVVRTLMMSLEKKPAPSLPSLKFVTCGSSVLTIEDVDRFESKMGVPLLNVYGITETSSWTAFPLRDPNRPKDSVGRAFRSEIRAVDPETRAPVPPGSEGELQIKGPSIMLGYLDLEEQTKKVLQDGWFSTGDMGKVDADGNVFLLSRIKDIIIRAGLNVYPAEIDQVLLRHPSVADAVSLGIEDAVLGERIAACVVLRPGATATDRELIDHCREFLAAYKCPERFKFVTEIQKTARGKVNRKNLRPLFAA